MYKDLIFEKILFTIRMCFEHNTKVLEVPFSSVKGQNNIIFFSSGKSICENVVFLGNFEPNSLDII